MATDDRFRRFALRSTSGGSLPYGAWWPESRHLGEELSGLFALWPPESGRIARVLYSPPDWDDRPRSVAVPGRRVKTGSFPGDDTRQLVLTMLDGRRLAIGVIPPATPAAEAAALLVDATGAQQAAHLVDAAGPRVETEEARSSWDNEGGHS